MRDIKKGYREMQQEEKKQIKLEIKLDEEIAQGVYCNFAIINHTQTEFALDFVFVQPQEPKAKVRARIITSPLHIKRFVNALSENISKYERKFGVVEMPEPLPGEQ